MSRIELTDLIYKIVLGLGVLVSIFASLRNNVKLQTIHVLINSQLSDFKVQTAQLIDTKVAEARLDEAHVTETKRAEAFSRGVDFGRVTESRAEEIKP